MSRQSIQYSVNTSPQPVKRDPDKFLCNLTTINYFITTDVTKANQKLRDVQNKFSQGDLVVTHELRR